MKFEIWEFKDEGGATWHLQPLDTPDARYDAFLKHVEVQTMEASVVHTFEAESEPEAEVFYKEYIGF